MDLTAGIPFACSILQEVIQCHTREHDGGIKTQPFTKDNGLQKVYVLSTPRSAEVAILFFFLRKVTSSNLGSSNPSSLIWHSLINAT